ncbi:MAG TPA: FAD-dependent oxidoreductase, partial [Thermoanaerobaculia bacterium]|nr:FAD-dependent oxidoreductase [Thermoanaerobaculia bacterium]
MEPHTTSLWLESSPAPRHEPLRRDGLHVDVAIVGAGITGLTAAVLLKQRGRTVAVIEKERVGGGETGNTTAHITEAVDARYYFIARVFDKEAARLVAQASRASIEQIAQLVHEFAIQCRFKRVPGYLYTEKRSFVAEVKREAQAAAEAGLAAKYVSEVPLPFAIRGGVLFENQAQFHPQEYLAGLAARIHGDGSFLFERTHVRGIEDGEPCVIETDGGKLTAGAVIQATNVPIVSFTTLHVKDAAYRTYAMAYPSKGAHPDGLFWDTAEPYHYTRWQETGEGEFMIVGGSDHKVGQEADTEKCFTGLQQYVDEHFGPQQPRYRWSGQVIDPVDGLPYIGRSGNIYVSTGYAGQGMTFGTAGAMICADLITGRENAWAELFDWKRVHARGAIKDFISENVDYPRRMIMDRLVRSNVETKDVADVKPGEGKIVSVGGRKLAVHRDDAGTLHALSPVCTHMGCDVAWNDAERTWDCPCHGSRFKTTGEVLNGPAH